MKWVVVANSNDCRIYKYDTNIKQLKLIEELNHPENKLKEKDLVSDKYGFYQNIGMRRGSYEPELNHSELAINNFTKEMAGFLNIGRVKHLYNELILLMPPVIEGTLLKHLNKNVFSFIKKIIQKNLTKLSERDLKLYLKKNLKYSGLLH